MTREECIARYRAEELRSRTGATVTMLSKLKDAKYREEYGLYLAEGVKLAEEALAADMEMEMLFWDTLRNACSMSDWQKRLYKQIAFNAQDDAALVAVCYGFGTIFAKIYIVLLKKSNTQNIQYVI